MDVDIETFEAGRLYFAICHLSNRNIHACMLIGWGTRIFLNEESMSIV